MSVHRTIGPLVLERGMGEGIIAHKDGRFHSQSLFVNLNQSQQFIMELTHCILGNFSGFFCRLLIFFKIIFLKKFFQEYHQNVKQFGP